MSVPTGDLQGSFTFTDIDGEEREVSLKLRTRGNYRRDASHCDFALRLNFPKNDVYRTLLSGQDKLNSSRTAATTSSSSSTTCSASTSSIDCS